jgi:hypothetical protein
MSAAKKGKRLCPGELDGQVLAYMRKHLDGGPLTASAIGEGIERSAGAGAYCLARLAKDGKVRRAKSARAPTSSRGAKLK